MIKRLILFTFLFIYKFSVFSQLYFNEVSSSVDFNHTYFQGVSGAGVSFVDFDNDGLDDISIPTNDYSALLFFKNNGLREEIEELYLEVTQMVQHLGTLGLQIMDRIVLILPNIVVVLM